MTLSFSRLSMVAVMLALAACGPDQDKIDNLAAAEGIASNDAAPEVEPEPTPPPPVVNNPALADDLAGPPDTAAGDEPADDRPAPPPAPAPVAQPSFDCSGDLNRVEALICSDPGLARLDRQVANVYFRATRRANSDQAARLERIGRRYLADRNRCPDADCVAQAYRWYQRDIELIMGVPSN